MLALVLKLYPVGEQVALLAAEHIRAFQAKGRTLHFIDAAIAATCLTHNITLVTYNPKHYPMPELGIHRVG